jgi:hypothetical protein
MVKQNGSSITPDITYDVIAQFLRTTLGKIAAVTIKRVSTQKEIGRNTGNIEKMIQIKREYPFIFITIRSIFVDTKIWY